MINIKEALKTVERDLKIEGKKVDKYNLIKKLCDYIGETEFDRASYDDIYNGYKSSLRLADGKIADYSTIRYEIDNYLSKIEEQELRLELKKKRMCLGFFKSKIQDLAEMTENEEEIEKLEKVIADIEKLKKDFLKVEL